MSAERPPLLVTALGNRHDQPVPYALDGREERSRFAGAALARLLALPAGARAAVLVTEGSARFYEEAAAELRAAGLQPESAPVPDGRTADEVQSVFAAIAERVAPGERVVFDLTHGLRSLPFAAFTALVYLQALRDVRVESVHYGALYLRGEGPAPFVELTPLLRLVDWYHAIRLAREAGDFRGVADAPRAGRDLSKLKRPARELSAALAAGLPLDAAVWARAFLDASSRLPETGAVALPARLAVEPLAQAVRAFADPAPAFAEKKDAVLDGDELARELRLSGFYLERGAVPLALLVLREWMINAALLFRGETDDWLDYGRRRRPAEAFLNALDARAQAGLSSEAESEVASLWKSIADRRNDYAHAGMRAEPVAVSPEKVAALLDGCRNLLGGTTLARAAAPRAGGKLLVTPLGLSPGVLYTAVRRLRPDRALVITSPDARARLAEALEAASARDLPCHTLDLKDPHHGFVEAGALARRAGVLEQVSGAAEVTVNVTGGTTAMQHVCERLADLALRLGVPVRRVALVDRRPYEAQRKEPYVEGEVVELGDATTEGKD